jgi:hypothetical protein
MKKLILITISVIYSSFSFGALDCPDVNLYETNKRLNSMPIEFQGDMNTCYAHSLAQNYNMSVAQTSEDKISAYWIAFLHKNKNIHWNPKDMDFSMLAWASIDLKKWGKCDYSTLETNINEYKHGTPYSHDQFFFLYKYYFKTIKNKDTNIDSKWKSILSSLIKKLNDETKKYTYPWKKSDLLKVLNPIRVSSNGKSFFDFLKGSIYSNCIATKTDINYSLDVYGLNFETNEDLSTKTGEYLSQGRAISFGHCPDVIYDEGAFNKKNIETKPRLFKSFSKKCGAHYAMLVGSRKNSKNKCEYLVRNSYGKAFWADKSYSCYCEDKVTKERSNCSKSNFRANDTTVLGCWIDAERLLTNTYELDVILNE